MIGTDFDGGFFYNNQVTGTGICFASSPGGSLEGNVAISGGQGAYEGANGFILFLCVEDECGILVKACSWPILDPGFY